jgi:hypothetical protein
MPSNTLNPYCMPALTNGTTPSADGRKLPSIQIYFAVPAMVSPDPIDSNSSD